MSENISRRYTRRGLLAAALVPEAAAWYSVLRPAADPVSGPGNRRIPFGWKGFRVAPGERARLLAPGSGIPAGPARLRLAVAVDYRDEAVLLVRTGGGGVALGRMDIRWAGAFQVFELVLSQRDTETVAREGVELEQVAGVEPLYLFAPSEGLPAELRPHLMQPGRLAAAEEARRRLRSTGVLQQWSWKLGCVLDGLLELGERDAAKRLIDMHFPDGRTLVYEDPRSVPADGRIYGVEGVLCFGALARVAPDHPGVELAVEFGRKFKESGHYSTEGCYTVGYPLAVIAKQRKDLQLREAALGVLRRRREVLAGKEVIWQRGRPGELFFPNWARGLAWYLLGYGHSMRYLGVESDILSEFRRVARLSLELRLANGLWPVFADDPHTGVDTSGSAGIAAALAMGARAGWLGAEAREAAKLAKRGLDGYLTPDGFLTGQAQENKKGEELQRSGYRAMAQLGLGLWAQLEGALSRPARGSGNEGS